VAWISESRFNHHRCEAYVSPCQIWETTPSTNRAASQLSYDSAGNVLYDGIHAYVYDAENRLAMVDAGMSYIYDAEGRRVGKSDGTVYTVDGGGNVLDEVDGATWKRSEVYLGGHHLATVNSTGVIFVHSDWLGTERARTNMAGVVCETITSQPFGDNVHKTGSCDASPDFFTGKPRDAESNLDDFGARYFSSQWGRWMSADWTAAPSAVPYATLTNPQSLNLYAYVGNDPIDGQDADGHARYDTGASGCAIYRSMCSAGGDYGGSGGPPMPLSDADIKYYQELLEEQAGPGAVPPDAATPASTAAAPPQNASGATASSSPAQGQNSQNQQVTITYDKGVPAMQPKTQDYVEKVANAAGVDSINISATTNGKHAPNSNHYNGTAVDINKVNGDRVINAGTDPSVAANVRSIQNTANSPSVGVAHENYGPSGLFKDGRQITNSALQSQHENHIHITIPRNTDDDN
jgi:RHS repeat-associated protein